MTDPNGSGSWVPWRVYQQDREEDRRDREIVRKEHREDSDKVLAKLDAVLERVGRLEAHDERGAGARSVGSTMLVIVPVLAAVGSAIAAWIARF